MNSCNFVGSVAGEPSKNTARGSGIPYTRFIVRVRKPTVDKYAMFPVVAYGNLAEKVVNKLVKENTIVAIHCEAATSRRKTPSGEAYFEVYFVLKDINVLSYLPKDGAKEAVVTEVTEDEALDFMPE